MAETLLIEGIATGHIVLDIMSSDNVNEDNLLAANSRLVANDTVNPESNVAGASNLPVVIPLDNNVTSAINGLNNKLIEVTNKLQWLANIVCSHQVFTDAIPLNTPKRIRTMAPINVTPTLSTDNTPVQVNKLDKKSDWMTPNRRKRQRKPESVAKSTGTAANTNYYQDLTEQDDSNMDVGSETDSVAVEIDANEFNDKDVNNVSNFQDNSHVSTTHIASSHENSNNVAGPKIRPIQVKSVRGKKDKVLPSSVGNATKKIKMPPIIASIFNLKDFVGILKDLSIVNFRFNQNLRSGRTTIYPLDRPTFDAIIKVLSDNRVSYHTQAPPDERRFNLILKGIPISFDVEDVKEEFAKFGFGDAVKIVPLKNNSKTHFNYFILSFAPGVQCRHIIGEHRMLFTTVKIEKFNRNSPPQCFRCSQLGHVQGYCGEKFCCHKCGKEHANPEDCTITDESPASDKFCILCKQHGHTASYRGCPVFKREEARIKDRKAAKAKPVRSFVSSYVQPSVSFADAAAPGGVGTIGSVPNISTPVNHSLSSAKSFLDEACMECYGCSYDDFKNKFNTFYFKYTNAKSRDARRALLNQFLELPSLTP